MALKIKLGSFGGAVLLIAAVVVAIGGGTYFFGFSEPLFRLFDGEDVSISPGNADGSNAELVALGQKVYRAQCAACHGVNLQGQPDWRLPLPNGRLPAPPHDDSGHTWHHDDQTLFAITKFGAAKFTGLDIESDMPVYEEILTDEEIWAALAYIKQNWSENTQERNAEINRRAKTLNQN